MTTTQLCTYVHPLIVSISKRFTSSPQIRVGLSLVFYSCDNHDIKADDCLLPKTMDRIVRSLLGLIWSITVAGVYLPCSKHITQRG